MMTRALVCLILVVSCAHALVHVYEWSLPSVEQEIASHYFPHDEAAGKAANGLLAFCWRLPLGLGALAAGYLVDRYGARRMLAIYLLGCAAMALLAGVSLSLPALFVVMLCMGTFACIYHPAGLALISHETTIDNRSRALGLHGIFGSLGIGSAPFAAALILTTCQAWSIPNGWRVYYWILAVPGLLLGITFLRMHYRRQRREKSTPAAAEHAGDGEDQANWPAFFLLAVVAVLVGSIYAGVSAFLPRYMGSAGIEFPGIPKEGTRNYLAGGVLLIGCLSQFLAGRFARHRYLELQLMIVFLGAVPCLLWMARASGYRFVAATSLFAFIHFMHQPIFNSMIAKYTPRSRRSLCYGLCFAMAFGVGGLGAVFAGYSRTNLLTFQTMAGIATTAAVLTAILWRWNRPARVAKI